MAGTVVRQCVRIACAFRFPGPDGESFRCPKCGANTNIVIFSLPESNRIDKQSEYEPSLVLEAGLDNIRSVLNVGSIFRTSDGAGVNHIHLFGFCPPPTHPQIQKTALGADLSTPWTQHWDGVAAVRRQKEMGYAIWCLENNERSVNLFTASPDNHETKIMLVVGNENSGIDPGILEISDRILYIPMIGIKESLNVSNAYAVAVYWIRFGCSKHFG